MANYNCVIRTNYFHVKDENTFEEFLKKVSGDDFHIFREGDMFGFGCYGSIYGISENNEDDEDDYDAFLEGLQKQIVDDEAIIITEAGYEKLRYVSGYATVITSQKISTINLEDKSIELAQEMVKNKEYYPQMSY